MSIYLCACLPACLPAFLPAYLPAFLAGWLAARLHLPGCLRACRVNCWLQLEVLVDRMGMADAAQLSAADAAQARTGRYRHLCQRSRSRHCCAVLCCAALP